ncbi:MAG: hypothetical protein PHG20_01185, partial [Geobacteraceae bacterium]|nr:hypothetical protein [Geobacteraceae bacterium]
MLKRFGTRGLAKRKSLATLCCVVCFVFWTVSACFAEPVSAPKNDQDEKEQVIMKSVLEAQKASVTPPQKKEPVGEGLAAKEGGEEEAPEEEAFFIADLIRWEGGEDRSVLEIVGEEEFLPGGNMDVGPDGRSFRWRPAHLLVVRAPKNNAVDSSLLQQVVFRENVLMTKKLELEAPYYVLSEIVMTFGEPVSYELTQDGNWMSLEFTTKKTEASSESFEEAPMESQSVMPETLSPADILGDFFQAKELYEAYIMGGGKPADLFRRLRSGARPSFGFFDGKAGFPRDMAPVFKEAYPVFGTLEYWKRHVRAVVRQTFGYSSDFDGTYGSWGGTSVKDGAFTMQPDIDVMYNGLGYGKPFYGSRKPTGTIDLGYRGEKIFPVAKDLGFGDGLRSQTVSWGTNYRPNKRHAFSSQNTLRLFGGKTLQKTRRGEVYREFRRGYRLTNAAGFNYRLTKRLLWKNGAGAERTLSDAKGGRSRDSSVFLSSAIEQVFTRRLQMETSYSYRHLYYDKEPYRKPSPYTKGKDIHSLSSDFRYKMSDKWFLSGGPNLDIIDGDIWKFGGRTRLQYQWRPEDQVLVSYDNAMIQNGSAKILGGLTSNRSNSSSITLSRFEI